jgi:hypothetical protein
MTRQIKIIGKGHYAVAENQQFVDRNGQLVRVTRDNPRNPTPVGTAYAFFDCNASLKEVNEEVEDRVFNLSSDTQSKLEISLNEMSDFRKSCEDIKLLNVLDNVPFYLKEKATLGRMKDLKYALTARYASGTNNDAGNALCTIMNGVEARYHKDISFTSQIVGRCPNREYGPWESV